MSRNILTYSIVIYGWGLICWKRNLHASILKNAAFMLNKGGESVEEPSREKTWIVWKIIAPIAMMIVIFVLNAFLGKHIFIFAQSDKWYLLIGFAAVMLYCSWAFPDFFRHYKQNLRRTWYFLFLLGIVFMLTDKGFHTADWQTYTLYAGMFIFVDLALFLTPTISKIGGTELGVVSEVENVNEEMKQVIVKTKSKSHLFTTILDRVDKSAFSKQDWTDIDDYRNSLESFLSTYGEECRQEITVICKKDDDTFQQDLGISLGVEIQEEQLEMLNEEIIVQLDTQIVLIPFTQKIHPVVIAVVSCKEPVLQIDFDYLINLAIIHTWYVKE
jgi:hypothetical protein